MSGTLEEIDTLKRMVFFIERFCGDEKLKFSGLAGKGTKGFGRPVTLLWDGRGEGGSWTLTESNGDLVGTQTGGELGTVTGGKLLKILIEAECDFESLKAEMSQVVTTRALIADMVLENAKSILGREVIEASIQEANDKLNSLMELLVDGGEKKPQKPGKAGKAHLRVVLSE